MAAEIRAALVGMAVASRTTQVVPAVLAVAVPVVQAMVTRLGAFTAQARHLLHERPSRVQTRNRLREGRDAVNTRNLVEAYVVRWVLEDAPTTGAGADADADAGAGS